MKKINSIVILLIDCLFVNMALFMGLLIKFDGSIPAELLTIVPFSFFMSTIVSLFVFYLFGIYSTLWNYASIEDLVRILLATALSSIVQFLLAAYFEVLFSASVYIISWMVTFFCVGGARFINRLTKNLRVKNRKNMNKKRIMIIGAGDAASLRLCGLCHLGGGRSVWRIACGHGEEVWI